MAKFRAKIQNTIDMANDFDLQLANGTGSFESWPVENCAEIWAVRNAILDGVKLENMVIRTVNTVDGTVKPLCDNCINTFADLIKAMD
jgi:cytidine deaminase